jgi:hypothetical protein
VKTRVGRILGRPLYAGISQRVNANRVFVICFVLGFFLILPLLVWLLK